MITTTLRLIRKSVADILRNWHSLAIFAGLYAALLATLYGFVATREATIWQVLLTLLFVASAPVIFFLLQATIINRVRDSRIDWYRALRDSCKLALLALPVILAGVALASLLNRWQAHFPAPHVTAPSWQIAGSYPSAPQAGAVVTPQPMHWPTFLFSSLRSLLFGIVLPLVMIQLWIEFAGHDLLKLVGGGARALLTKLAHVLSRAFAPRSVLIYSVGLIFFAVLPYALLFVRMPLKAAWSDLSIFTARVGLVLGFTFFGWVITLSTFARTNELSAIERPEPQSEESA